jgi:hypothetical protein
MKHRFLSSALVLSIAAGVAACAAPSPTRVASASNGPISMSSPKEVVVHTSPACGDDNGGFGAPTRHFGNPTPWSELASNGC